MIGHLDCSTGVSGDKFLGAVLDVGQATQRFTADHLERVIGRIAPEASIRVKRVTSRGITALGVSVEASDTPPARAWRDIRELVSRAGLTAPVTDGALNVFRRLAEAEARVHGCSVEDVHFHEVGAIDSIVDVVGVCAGLEALGVRELTASWPATGWGSVQASHGVLPVPAPATEVLLAGITAIPGPAGTDGHAPGELTTPTGAALLATLVASFGPPPPMSRVAAGYGAGTRDIGHPNVCRLSVGEAVAPLEPRDAGDARETVVLLETNLDHLSPELVGNATETLLTAGALDVWQTPVLMKKQRAGVVLSLLTTIEAEGPLTGLIHELTGTLGVRRSELTRSVLPREILTFGTRFGPVRAKVGGGTVRPEHDDVARIARETGSTYEVIRAELFEQAQAALAARGETSIGAESAPGESRAGRA